MDEVEYRVVEGFSSYRVGSDGSVWSRRKSPEWRKLSPGYARGYPQIVFYNDAGQPVHRRVHRVILEAFVGPAPMGYDGCHNDGNRKNNALSNLRWDSRKANIADAIKHGTKPFGSWHANAKLTEADIVEIRAAWDERRMGQQEMARKYGVAAALIHHIVHRRIWRHVR